METKYQETWTGMNERNVIEKAEEFYLKNATDELEGPPLSETRKVYEQQYETLLKGCCKK